MGQPAVDTRAVDTRALVDRIQGQPAKLEDFLLRNPAVAGMLANVYSELVRAPESNLEAAVKALPAEPALAVVQSGAHDDRNATALANASDALPAPTITATATGALADLPDSREGFAPHRAYLFSVAPSKGTVLAELKTLLGEEAANQLVEDWGSRCDLNQTLPATQVALFLDSNNKAWNRSYANSGDKTTQEEDFQATEHQFPDGLAATLLCARIFKKAQGREPLSEGEEDLYQKLKCGSLNSLLGALSIDADGCLRADRYYVFGRQSCWALGSPLSPELK